MNGKVETVLLRVAAHFYLARDLPRGICLSYRGSVIHLAPSIHSYGELRERKCECTRAAGAAERNGGKTRRVAVN